MQTEVTAGMEVVFELPYCCVSAAAHSYVPQIAHEPRAVFLIQLFDLKLQL